MEAHFEAIGAALADRRDPRAIQVAVARLAAALTPDDLPRVTPAHVSMLRKVRRCPDSAACFAIARRSRIRGHPAPLRAPFWLQVYEINDQELRAHTIECVALLAKACAAGSKQAAVSADSLRVHKLVCEAFLRSALRHLQPDARLEGLSAIALISHCGVLAEEMFHSSHAKALMVSSRERARSGHPHAAQELPPCPPHGAHTSSVPPAPPCRPTPWTASTYRPPGSTLRSPWPPRSP